MGALTRARKEEVAYMTEAAVQGQQYLTFKLADELFAIGIAVIKEIIEYRPPTTVPMMPQYICGVINLRGRVVPVIDLLARFGRAKRCATPPSRTYRRPPIICTPPKLRPQKNLSSFRGRTWAH